MIFSCTWQMKFFFSPVHTALFKVVEPATASKLSARQRSVVGSPAGIVVQSFLFAKHRLHQLGLGGTPRKLGLEITSDALVASGCPYSVAR